VVEFREGVVVFGTVGVGLAVDDVVEGGEVDDDAVNRDVRAALHEFVIGAPTAGDE
jgi:hypothetical protein